MLEQFGRLMSQGAALVASDPPITSPSQLGPLPGFQLCRNRPRPRSLSAKARPSVPLRYFIKEEGIQRFDYADPNSLIKLKSEFSQERKSERTHRQYYLDEMVRERYRITYSNDFFTHPDLRLCEDFANEARVLTYVLLKDKQFYGSLSSSTLHHADLADGKKVSGAGVAYFCYQQLITLSNESGHYKPTVKEMIPALKWFLDKFELKQILFEDHSQLDKNLPFYGVRFFKVSIDNGCLILVLLNQAELIHYLETAQVQAEKKYLEKKKEQISIPPKAPLLIDVVISETDEDGAIYETDLKDIQSGDLKNEEKLPLCLRKFTFNRFIEERREKHHSISRAAGVITTRHQRGVCK